MLNSDAKRVVGAPSYYTMQGGGRLSYHKPVRTLGAIMPKPFACLAPLLAVLLTVR